MLFAPLVANRAGALLSTALLGQECGSANGLFDWLLLFGGGLVGWLRKSSGSGLVGLGEGVGLLIIDCFL